MSIVKMIQKNLWREGLRLRGLKMKILSYDDQFFCVFVIPGFQFDEIYALGNLIPFLVVAQPSNGIGQRAWGLRDRQRFYQTTGNVIN